MAVNDRRRNPQTGEWEDYPNFVDCTMFGTRAEAVSRYLSKGSKVAIEGKLRYSSWERDGQRRSKLEVIDFVDCTMFGTRAEAVSRYLSKGSKVAIEGKLRYSSWERDGQRRSKLEVIVDEIEFMSRGQQGEAGGYAPAPSYGQQRSSSCPAASRVRQAATPPPRLTASRAATPPRPLRSRLRRPWRLRFPLRSTSTMRTSRSKGCVIDGESSLEPSSRKVLRHG